MEKLVKLFFKSIGLYVRKRSFPKNELTKNRIIFIHVPKVAGHGLLNSLGINYNPHMNLYKYELDDKEKFNKYFKIGFVRNPWDRLVSAFFYLKQGGNGKSYDLMMKGKLSKFETFESFVIELNNNVRFRKEILKELHSSSQYSWLMNSIGEIEMDYIGKFESLENGFSILKEKLHKESAMLKEHNKSCHKQYWTYYSEETVEMVRRIYSKDVVTFNYDFPFEKLKSKI